MKPMLRTCLPVLLAICTPAAAEDAQPYVKLPLAAYDAMTNAVREGGDKVKTAPAEFALSKAQVEVRAAGSGGTPRAEVKVVLSVDILSAEWTAVPILPPGTALNEAVVDGRPAQLIVRPEGLLWGIKGPGAYAMTLKYSVDAQNTERGALLTVPLPQAAAVTLRAILPRGSTGAAVIPAAGMQISQVEEGTVLQAAVPPSRGVQISWLSAAGRQSTVSRAVYKGDLRDDSLFLRGEIEVYVEGTEPLVVDLLPSSAVVSEIRVDGKTAPLRVIDERFTTTVAGEGRHVAAVDFQVPVLREDGPPRAAVAIAAIPVSRFEINFPGKKEVTVTPSVKVLRREENGATFVAFNVPMTEQVDIGWTEAVPEDIKTEVRANASFYHAVHAEEGVLSVHAVAVYEITRGETNVLEFLAPANVQINRITSTSGAIADWRVAAAGAGPAVATVFLDRQASGELSLDIYYDRSIAGEKEAFPIPLLMPRNVHRQRGMAALLAGKELTLKPVEEEGAARVGENQLPAFLRQAIDRTIAHTFKYSQVEPRLRAQAVRPERSQGRFDAVVNTLVSLSDVTMKGTAGVEVSVKSGGIGELQLVLPGGINVLSLTAPSLRAYRVAPGEGGNQIADIQFTQDMEGQFRIEASYEKIVADAQSEVVVPTIKVAGAEVEQGRIAVEALSAVEVQAAAAEQLSSLEPGELPQQLVLKTTNPILLAYKYVHVDPPYRLALRITRHREVEVQSAAIDHAHYRTLYTADGMAVTAASFTVRNSRQQFLRVVLPRGSSVWSAAVDGIPEKPALAEGGKRGDGPEVLIKIINSTAGFPVSLVYQTPVPPVSFLGTVAAELARPNMVVTNTKWDVYLPDTAVYGRPRSNMAQLGRLRRASADAVKEAISKLGGARQREADSLQFDVPASGVLVSFEKLYANQSAAPAAFWAGYAEGTGRPAAALLLSCSALFFCAGLFLLALHRRTAPRQASGLLLSGTGLAALLLGYYGAPPDVPAAIAAISAAAAAVWCVRRRLKGRRAAADYLQPRTEEEPTPPAAD